MRPEERFVVEELVVGDNGRRAWGLRDMVTQRLVTCGDGETNWWPTPQAAQSARLTYHYLTERAEDTGGERYEARALPGAGSALALWGAWDTESGDWVRRLGTGAGAGHPEVFTSVDRVVTWAARQERADHDRESPGPAAGQQGNVSDGEPPAAATLPWRASS